MLGKNKYSFTVLTPTFNRAKYLPPLFESLKAQTFKDFEWVIVDDGSIDETESIVSGFKMIAPFPIRYVWKKNGGKHTAINLGASLAEGFFFAIMDDDDLYVPSALERFLYHWESIPAKKKNEFLGVCGLFKYDSGKIVGTQFPNDVLDTDDIELRIRYRVKGDKISVIRLDVMREFPFPENLGRFVTESIVWNRMAQRYKTRFVNEVFAIKKYQPGGLTDQGRALRVYNCKSSRLSHYELLSTHRKLPFDIAVRTYSNFIRYSLHEKIGWRGQVKEVPSKMFWLLCYPIGYGLAYRDRRLLRYLQNQGRELEKEC